MIPLDEDAPLGDNIAEFQQIPWWRRWAWPAVFVLVMLVALAQLYVTFRAADLSAQSERTADDTHSIAVAIEKQQDSMTIVLNEVRAVTALIEDCTTPVDQGGGECARRGEKSTGRAVSDIGRISIYAAACADRDGVGSASEIQACVERLLAKDDGETGE